METPANIDATYQEESRARLVQLNREIFGDAVTIIDETGAPETPEHIDSKTILQ